MSNLLKERCSLAKLREELERRKEKLCKSCKKFGYLAYNCRNRRKEEKRETTPLNKFEMLSSQVMQCGIEEKVIRRQEAAVVECFKCREKRYKYRDCPLWKTTKEEKKLRRAEEVAYVAKPQNAQQEGEIWEKSLTHVL